MTQKKILLAVAVASTGMVFATGCARPGKTQTQSAQSPTVTQEAARANIVSVGHQIVEKRYAFQLENLTNGYNTSVEAAKVATQKAIDESAQSLILADLTKDVETAQAAVKAADPVALPVANELLTIAQTALEEGRKAAQEKHDAQVAVLNQDLELRLANLAKDFEASKSDLAKGQEEAIAAYDSLVAKTLDGEKDEDGSVKTAPASFVTPIMINHEFMRTVAEGEKHIANIDASEELNAEQKLAAKLAQAKKGLELDAFKGSLKSAVTFGRSIYAYRMSEINSGSVAETFSKGAKRTAARDYTNARVQDLANLVIQSGLSFNEIGALKASKCVDSENGCGTHTNPMLGSNTDAAVKGAIESVFKGRDAEKQAKIVEGHKSAIRNHLMGCENASEESVNDIIAILPSTGLSWETLENAITSVPVSKEIVTTSSVEGSVEGTTETTTSVEKLSTQSVLESSILSRYFR